MWISKIKLTNFKAYQHAEFNFPKPTPGKNIVLLGAMNGHGKTSLLEAIYIGLYGSDALPYLERAGLQEEQSRNWSIWISKALHQGVQKRYGQRSPQFIQIQIEIEVRKDINKGLRILRKFSFDATTLNFNQKDETAEFFEINGQHSNRIPTAKEPLVLSTYVTPSSMAPFFFFDGEKLADRAIKHSKEFISKGLYQLCGIDLLKDLIEDIEGNNTYISACTATVPNDQDVEIRRLEGTIIVLEADSSIAKEREEECITQIAELKQNRGTVTDNIMQLIGGDARTAAEYAAAQHKAETTRDTHNKQINTCLGNSLAQALIPATLIQSFQQTQEKEKTRLNHEAVRKQASDRVNDFINNLRTNQKAIEAIGNLNLRSNELKEAITEAWDGLFYPLPPNCAANLWYTYLSLDGHADSRESLKKWGQSLPDMAKLMSESDLANLEYERATADLNRLEGTNIEELQAQQRALDSDLEKYQQELGGIQTVLKDEQRKISIHTGRLRGMQDALLAAQPTLVNIARARKVVACLNEITQKLIDTKLTATEEAATTIFKSIAHNQQVASIAFNAQREIVPKDSQEREILGLSAGERQILVIAILGALAKVSNYGAPMVIDTPLARLDKQHREKLWDYWASLPQQVIVLAQNAEVTEEDFDRIKSNINTVYTINSTMINNEAIAQNEYRLATITKETYFNQNLGG